MLAQLDLPQQQAAQKIMEMPQRLVWIDQMKVLAGQTVKVLTDQTPELFEQLMIQAPQKREPTDQTGCQRPLLSLLLSVQSLQQFREDSILCMSTSTACERHWSTVFAQLEALINQHLACCG